MRRIRKVLAAVLGMAMLLGSMSVMAAGMPTKAENPTWSDVWAIEEFIEEQIWRYDQPGHVEMSWYNNSDYPKEDAMKYEEPGRRLADSDKADRFGQIDSLYDLNENPVDDIYEDTVLTGTWRDNYEALYEAAKALYDSIGFATGECYNMDGLWSEWDAFWQRTDQFFQKKENGTIYVVDDLNGEEPPTAGEWINLSALMEFEQAVDDIGNIGDTWNDPTRSQLQQQLDAFQAAINKVTKSGNGKFVFPGLTPSQSPSVPSSKSSKSSKSKDTAAANVHEHRFEDVILQEATALQDGQVGRQCVICGAIESGSTAWVSAYAVFMKDTVTAIEKASGAELTINTDRWVSFDKSVFDALAKKPGLALTVNYVYNHKQYTVTIPAGTDVSGLCNEDGFCGFRYLDAQFGGKELV